MQADLYFVAYYKHDAPQHLVAGPYVDLGDALNKAKEHPQYMVVKTTLEFDQL